MKKIITLILVFTSIVCQAQEVQMAETMRSEGKIYVVVSVLCIILIGLFIYLISIDKKLKKLEQEIKK